MVGHRDRLGETLRLIVNATRSDGVHIAPIILGLRVNEWITVALGGGSQKEGGAFVLRQAEGVMGAERADFQRRDRNPQIIDRARGRGEMPHIVHLTGDVDEVGDIVVDELVVLIPREMLDVRDIARDEVVDRNDAVAFLEQPVREMGSQKPGSAGDDTDGLRDVRGHGGGIRFSSSRKLGCL